MSRQQLVDGIGSMNAVITGAQWELLEFVREFDAREHWKADGCRDMGQWLAGHLKISVSAGNRWTQAAHALPKLPFLSEALRKGELSLDMVVQLARFATPEDEARLIKWAKGTSLNAVRRKAELSERPPATDEVKAAHEARFVSWWNCDDVGSIFIEGLLPAHEGAVVTKALRRVADRMAGDPDGATTNGQRCADALYALASQELAEDADADRATVVVSAELPALIDGDRVSEIEGLGSLHPTTLQRICCDSRIQVVTRDQRGLALDIGRASRTIPGYMRREMLQRDGGCTFPGCGTRAFVDGHHVWPWEWGGRTALENLITACHFHHKLLHESGWRVQLDRDQRAEWYRSDGSRYDPAAPRPAPDLEPVPEGLTWDELEEWGKTLTA